MDDTETLCNPLSGEGAELKQELSLLPGRLLKLVPHLAIGIATAILIGSGWGMLCGVGTLIVHIKVRSK